MERAKKCLDFSFTIQFIHFLATTSHSGFPKSWTWWIVVAVAILITSVVGEFLCMRREMEEIKLGASRMVVHEV